MFSIADGRDFFYQWDENVRIEIKGCGISEIHFSHSGFSKPVGQEVNKSEEESQWVEVPNDMLQKAGMITVYAYVKQEDGRYTKSAKTFNIKSRPKPPGYVNDKQEVITFEKLVADTQEAVNKANAVVEDLEKKRDSGYFDGEDGKDGKDGYTPKRGVDYLTEADIALAMLMAKDAVKDYIADELKGPQSEIEELRSELVEMRNVVASLENMIVPCDPFDLVFATGNPLAQADKNTYMTVDTIGDNWRASAESTAGVFSLDANSSSYARVFPGNDYTFLRAMSHGKDYVFDFSATAARYYRITANVVLADSGGYADIYVNDVKVGTIDTYNAEQKLETFSLGTVRLNAGEFANTIKIVPNGISGGTKCRPSFVGFSFTTP